MPNEIPTVSVRAVTKSYGVHTVLEEVSLSIQRGEIFAIMGPSGAGKSVLLRQIIGLEEPDSGEILLEGLSASDPATHEKVGTGIVFQAGALFNSLTVFENCALYLEEHRKLSKSAIKEKVMAVLKTLSLENAAGKYPSELSGGMKKRVAVARALIMEPKIMLYDEPTSELDPVMAATVGELIGTVRKETGVTSIIVSHDFTLCLAIADRIALLKDGRIVTIATPNELKNSTDPVISSFLNPTIDLKAPRFRKSA